MKKVLLTLLSLVLLSSCGSLPSTTTQQKRVVKNYDWTPKSTAPAKSADVTLLLVNPKYGKEFKDEKEPIFKKFRKNMGVDFEELLVAKGYTIRGPFNSYDEVVFKDKQDSDLLMEVEINFNAEAAQGTLKRSKNILASSMLGKNVYSYFLDGELYLGGKINIILKEPSTSEKLWVKSLPLEDKTVVLKTAKYENKRALDSAPGYLNPMQEVLDEYYQSSMNKAWKYLEPAELKQLKKQVQAIRKKKTY